MTSIKQILCGTAVASLVAGTGAAIGAPIGYVGPSALDWLLAAEHVLLIGTDGTNLDKILQYAYGDDSGFKVAMDQGITGAASEVNHTTISGPSWSTILTGVWDTKHGVINNLFTPTPYNAWPTVFNLLEAHDPNINTTVVADWDYINGIGAAGAHPADNNFLIPFQDDWATTDAQVTAQTIAQILATADSPNISNFLFSYQVQVDEAGHGFGGGSPEYAQAVMNVGANIKEILAAVAQVKAATGDDWSVIITTDHGHQQSLGFGHGFQSPNETSQFVIFDQAGDHTTDGGQNLNFSIADITPTILALFGAPMRSDFDGVSMTDPSILNSFVQPDDLKQALLAAISMFGYPNIGNDITLAIRTLFTSVPYFLDKFINDISNYLQPIVDQDIFLISGLAEFAQQAIKFTGGLAVGATEALAQAVAHMTGVGTIAPTDPPLSAEFSDVWGLLGGDHGFAAPDLALPDFDVA
ncbi:alkaline phosphatase family protein [Mycobacterium sp. CSUR Q5927]|nr:alkaline phosphatase family protein [Mycobacterium sp. CSUR Q5927]